MRPSEFKIRYDPNLDRYVMKHVHDETRYGEGFGDLIKSVGKKLFGKTTKSIAKTAAKSAATKAATKTGEYAGKKAGDKIVELLSKKKTTTPSVQMEPNISILQSLSQPKELTPDEINDRVNMLLSGGMLRRRKFI